MGSRVRVDGQARTFVLWGAVEVPLPSPGDLKVQARDLIAGSAMPPAERDRVEGLLDACAFDYEVAAGRDGIADVLGLVVYTDAGHARALTDWEAYSALMSALASACPALGAERVVVLE